MCAYAWAMAPSPACSWSTISWKSGRADGTSCKSFLTSANTSLLMLSGLFRCSPSRIALITLKMSKEQTLSTNLRSFYKSKIMWSSPVAFPGPATKVVRRKNPGNRDPRNPARSPLRTRAFRTWTRRCCVWTGPTGALPGDTCNIKHEISNGHRHTSKHIICVKWY